MTIHITLTHNKKILYTLCPEWTALQANSEASGIYVTWEWVSTWWKHFGDEQEMWLLQARDETGRLVGVSVLELVKHSPSPKYLPMIQWRQLQFSGATRGCEHLGFVIQRGLEDKITDAFIKKLQEHQSKWDVLHVSGLCDQSHNFQTLANANLEWFIDVDVVAPYLTLPNNWDVYFEGLSKVKRKNERRRLRHLEEVYGNNWSFERVTDPNLLHPTLHKLVELHQKTWTARGIEGAFGDPHFQAFYYDIAYVFLKQGWLRLYRLLFGDEVVGVLCTYESNKRVYDFVSGVNHDYDEFGVGHLLTHFSLKNAIEDGVQEYDFLWGTEPYKYEWRAMDRAHHSFTWHATTHSRVKQKMVDQIRVLRQRLQDMKESNARSHKAETENAPEVPEKP